MIIGYINGEYKPLADIRVSAMDRGFLFGDGVYEVIPVYHGHIFRLEEHLERLVNSLNGIHLSEAINRVFWRELCKELVKQNGLGDQSIYLHITRGTSETRDHLFPENCKPTLFAFSKPFTPPPITTIKAVTLPDTRWQLCHIKAVTLLANILQRQNAREHDAQEAILINQGHAIECTASNLFIVKNGIIITPPSCSQMLGGITRDLILELAAKHNLPLQEKPIPETDLFSADEIWVSSSLREIQPVIKLNEQIVGQGMAGPVWEKMYGFYQEYKLSLKNNIYSQQLDSRVGAEPTSNRNV